MVPSAPHEYNFPWAVMDKSVTPPSERKRRDLACSPVNDVSSVMVLRSITYVIEIKHYTE